MYYSITSLCPQTGGMVMGGYGFMIKLFPGWRDLVSTDELNQQMADTAIQRLGRTWLDACGFGQMFDPENPQARFGEKSKPLGPKARKLYKPSAIRVSWGEWGPEHISVPGDACGLDLSERIHAPRGGRVLTPHNIDNWRQVQLLLVVFCFFAETLSLAGEIAAADARSSESLSGGGVT